MGHLHPAADAPVKAVHQGQPRPAKRLVMGALIGQPDLPRPEPAGPLLVLAGGINPVHAGVVLAFVCVSGQVETHLLHRLVQRGPGLGVGDRYGSVHKSSSI